MKRMTAGDLQALELLMQTTPGFEHYDSGVDFSNRPGFQKMLAEIEAGHVEVVITKDYCAIIGLNQKDLENQGILA